MELLRKHLNKVRIPSGSNKVYKEECCVSFETPKSEGGLYVDLNSFLAFGKEYVKWNYEKTGDPVYLHIKKTPKPGPEEEQPRKKPTIVGIGVDGGFQDKQEEYDETLSICILPDFVELSYPDVNLPEKVRSAVEQVRAAQGAERRDQLAAWTADKKTVSKFAENLQQLDNGARIGASDWKCRFCDKTENLWLNLTDGSILCGRKNWDGTGGNNHALEYYNQTQYPLVVKLGTITADLTQADVYSYPEDDAVEDPLLAKHLQHFGIDFSSLQKTESTTAELELDQNLNFDFTRLQEKGKELEPLFGPGYTGLANLGNSCYLASVVQAVLTTKDFQKRYFQESDLETCFKQAPTDPTLDFNFQMTKLAHGVLSGAYSLPANDSSHSTPADASKPGQDGIPPRMFKSLVGQGHPEFSSSRQQDAFEFYQHLLDLIEKSNPGGGVSKAFRFQVQERIQCGASGKVKYTSRGDNVLSLQIPLEKATNKKEVADYEKRKAEKEAAGEKLAADDVVRPRVPLSACLEAFAGPETIQDFYSSAIKAKTTATKTAALGTFPPYLVLHMRKFVLDQGWVPRKLDVFVDVPEQLDLEGLRATGKKEGEEELPEDDGQEAAPQGPVADPGIVSALEDMGFPRVRCEKAAINTQNGGVEAAMNWLLAHMEDPDIDTPLAAPTARAPVDEAAVETLAAIGFSAAVARKALQETGGNVEAAAEWIFAHPEAMEIEQAGPTGGAAQGSNSQENFLDGPPKYNLLAFVSHMGSSTHAGHYVAHIKKDGRWVIFNDNKVAASGDPPTDMGYLYFYQRAE